MAALKVINDVIEALDNKQHCAALFIDLSKAFDTVDHTLAKQRLVPVGLLEHLKITFLIEHNAYRQTVLLQNYLLWLMVSFRVQF